MTKALYELALYQITCLWVYHIISYHFGFQV